MELSLIISMRLKSILLLLSICFGCCSISQNAFAFVPQTEQADTQSAATDLRTLSDEVISVPPQDGHLVICFLGIECPLAKLYTPRINALATEFQRQGFQFVAVNSNRQDSIQEWREFAKTNKLDLPLVKDHDNLFADRFNVVRNPEVIVINAEEKVAYRGRIDDQYSPGIARAKVARQDLRIALTELASGKAVSVPVTKPEGCLIGRIKKTNTEATITYAQHIAPILQKNCVECHRSGEIGPFAMVDYDEVVGWADMIVETIDNGRMPPWHADPTIGKFTNARGLSDDEKQMIRTWVDEGAAPGNASLLPEAAEFTAGWRLPKEPDLVVPMRKQPFAVPADGSIEYQYFVVDPGFTEDKWVSAAEIIPGNRSVVHHSIVFIRPPDGDFGVGLNWLEAYVPGQVPVEYVASRARRIPAGSKLVFQQHYTPNGQAQTDLTSIGLVFVDEEQVQEELLTIAAINQEFEIQPHQANLTVQARIDRLPEHGKLLSVSPHMHYRGKSFAAFANADTQSQNPLISVPNYDFNWQHNYEFSEPLLLNDLKSIEIEITFDNSEANPFNPNPDEFVVWGDQTWEEMAVGFFNVAIPRNPPETTALADDDAAETKPANETAEYQYSAEVLSKAKQHAEAVFRKNDTNGDGQLTKDEVPIAFRDFFDSIDTNRDGVLQQEEFEFTARGAYEYLETLRDE